MATKKQKREAGLAKREAFLAEQKSQGLHAQEMDKQQRAADQNHMKKKAEALNARYNAILAVHADELTAYSDLHRVDGEDQDVAVDSVLRTREN